MTTIRTKKKRNPYVSIDKTPLLDSSLSWQARGIMAYILAKPDDWTVRIGDLVKQSPDTRGQGKTAVQSCLKELEQKGYIARVRTKNDKGQFASWEMFVFETPGDRKRWEKSNKKALANDPTDDQFKPLSVEADDGLTRRPVEAVVGSPENRFNCPLINKEDLIINDDQLINEKEEERKKDARTSPVKGNWPQDDPNPSGKARAENHVSDADKVEAQYTAKPEPKPRWLSGGTKRNPKLTPGFAEFMETAWWPNSWQRKKDREFLPSLLTMIRFAKSETGKGEEDLIALNLYYDKFEQEAIAQKDDPGNAYEFVRFNSKAIASDPIWSGPEGKELLERLNSKKADVEIINYDYHQDEIRGRINGEKYRFKMIQATKKWTMRKAA